MYIQIEFNQALELCKSGKPDFITYRQWRTFRRSLAREMGQRLRLDALRAEQAQSRTTTRPDSKNQFRPSVLAA